MGYYNDRYIAGSGHPIKTPMLSYIGKSPRIKYIYSNSLGLKKLAL